jgi:homogentisate 1,2-dioxygenase
MSAHGPEYEVFKKQSEIELKPVKYTGGLAFMFESMYMINPTEWASKNFVDEKYNECWQPYKKQFNPKQK